MPGQSLDAVLIKQIRVVLDFQLDFVAVVGQNQSQVELGNFGLSLKRFGNEPRQSYELNLAVAIAPVQCNLKNRRIAEIALRLHRGHNLIEWRGPVSINAD